MGNNTNDNTIEVGDININNNTSEVIGTIQKAEELVASTAENSVARQDALQVIIEMLFRQTNIIRQAEETKKVAKLFGYKVNVIEKFLKNFRETQISSDDPNAPLPSWCNAEKLYADGFVQLNITEKNYRAGIYFAGQEQRLKRVSNFTIHPLIHIMDQRNNRRIIEINNGKKISRVEVPGRALVGKGLFEATIIDKGSYLCEGMNELQFKRIVGWLTDEMPVCFDLVSLGWQADGKGFFAFANKVSYQGELRSFNPLGVVEVGDTHYISMGISNINNDYRQTDNPYENDLYLKHVENHGVHMEQWSKQFLRVYGSQNAPIGIAFVFISLFKDIVISVTKCPHLYPYGPKGSGKSDFAESITRLFFSGKNAEGKLIPGINLNIGQITPFAFYNALERFSNCPMLLNEFDENKMEDWKFGTIKSAYDGEARITGDSDTGKARKSKVQKVRGTLIIVGQYLSTGDGGSVLSRSFPCQFLLSKVKGLSAEDNAEWVILKDWEDLGLSSIICEIQQHRDFFQDNFRKEYWLVLQDLSANLKKINIRAETRLLRNYACALAVIKIMAQKLKLPFTYDEFFQLCTHSVAEHNSLLQDNNALAKFWKIVEYCFTRNSINYDPIAHLHVSSDYDIIRVRSLRIKKNNEINEYQLAKETNVLLIRFNLVYGAFSKVWREQMGSQAPAEGTILKYLQDQPYYIGLVPSHNYHHTNTSGFAFNYDILNQDIVLEPNATVKIQLTEKVAATPKTDSGAEKTEKTETADPDTPF